MRLSLNSVWEYISKCCLYLALFLTPIFFLPWTLYPATLNKQTLLALLIFLGAIAWLIRGVSQGEFDLGRSPLSSLLVALVIFVAFSVWFSGAGGAGFLGNTGAEPDTFINIFTLSLLYFLLVSVLREEEAIERAIKLLSWSSLLLVIFSLFQLFGVWLLPWDFTKSAAFNPIGSVNALGIYLGFVFVLAFSALYLGFKTFSRLTKSLLVALAVLSFITIFLISYWPVFAGLILAMLILVAIDLRNNNPNANRRLILPLALIAVSILLILVNFGFINLRLPGVAVPAEVSPSFQATGQIAKASLGQGAKNFVLGSGPGTFQYQYGLFRDPGLNQTLFWNVRFAQGFNSLLTHLVNWGILGTALFLLVLLVLLATIFKALNNRRQSKLAMALGIGLVYLVLLLFFYPQNLVVYFALFAGAGLMVSAKALSEDDYRTWSLVSSPYKTFVLSLVMMLVIMLVASLLYINSQRYWGAIRFAQGVNITNSAGDIEKAMPLLLAGRDLDPRNDFYHRVLADAFLLRVTNLVNDADVAGAPSAELQAQFAGNVGAAIQAAQRAAQINPRNSLNWVTLAQVYENVMSLVAGSAELAFNAYEEAAKLEPNNPIIPASLGRAHLAAADLLPKDQRDKNYQAAIDSLDKAITLKPDYAPAHFSLVQVFDRQGKTEEAVARAERLRSLAPNDVGILFQLGLLHYQAERLNKAREVLEAVIRLSPDYANALYFLGLIEDRQGDRETAIQTFRHIQRLNADNEEVKKILRNLRRGDPALTGLGTAPEERQQAPIEEEKEEKVLEKR